MSGNEHERKQEQPLNGSGTYDPIAHPEIGPADYADLIDFHDDEEFEFIDDIDSDDEMEPLQIVPYQAVQFLVDVAAEEQPVEVPAEMEDIGQGDEVSAQEPASQSSLEEDEAPGDLHRVIDNYPEDAQPADEAKTDENQQLMEIVAEIENESKDANQEVVEHQAMNAGNQLGQEQNPQHSDSPNRLVEDYDQDLNRSSSASDADQELNRGLPASGKDQISDGSSTASGERNQEPDGSSAASGHDQEPDGSSAASGHDQEPDGSSAASGHDQEPDGNSPVLAQNKELNGGSSESGAGTNEQVCKGGIIDVEEAMERLELKMEVNLDIQVAPIRGGVEEQDNMEDQIKEKMQVVGEEESRREEIVQEKLNGVSNSGELSENQQGNVHQMFANEEAVLLPEIIPEPVQVEEDIEADLNADLIPDEQDNLVEEIIQEPMVPGHEPAGGMEAGDNVVPQGELVDAIETGDRVVSDGEVE